MKAIYLFLAGLCLSYSLQAQTTNYVANTANASSPGERNTLVGLGAGNRITTGNSNSFFGLNAGATTTTGYSNSFFGVYAGLSNTTGIGNTFLGNAAGIGTTTGSNNSFVGVGAGRSNTTGDVNSFMGYQAGANNTSGYSNVAIGVASSYTNTTGHNNVVIGDSAGLRSTLSENVFVGSKAGLDNVTGSSNTFLGHRAGVNNTTGSRNTFIGVGASAPVGSGTISNATAIGYNATVTMSNALVLGNEVNVGIGTSSPRAKLEIASGADAVSGLRFTNLNSGSRSMLTNQFKFLTVDDKGNVVLGTTYSEGRVAADETLWQRNTSGFLQPTSHDGAVVIGQGVSKLPTDYNLFVSKGILTERVKVALKNSSEWSDYVFAFGYRLRSLAEVEQAIQQTGHLPGVPSASEMVEQGNDLHKTDAKLLEKIEELTLYSIAQDKRINEQQQTIKHQQQRMEKLEQMLQELLQKK